MPRRLTLEIELEEIRAELRRWAPVVAAARELYTADCSGDATRRTEAMRRFAVLDHPHSPRMRHNERARIAVLRLSNDVGTTRAAQLTGIPAGTITHWRYVTHAKPLKPRRAGKTPPGRACPAKRARALIAEMYAAAVRR